MNKAEAGETNWVEFYRAALLETDRAKLRDRIVAGTESASRKST
jgi:hypothetical protein